MKKQKLLFGLLAFILIANLVIPNVVLATDELTTEVETIQEEVVLDEEKTAEVEEEAIVEETEVVPVEETNVEDVPTTVSQKAYSDELKYTSDYNTQKTYVIARMDENQTFYLPAELAEPGTDTRILQSIFLLDEVGNIAATKQITILNYGRPYEGANYRLMEDEEHPLFRVTPVNANGDYSTTPSSYKIEFLHVGQDYTGDFSFDFNYHNEHKGYSEAYNEETGLYDRYSNFNIYPTLKVHFVRYGRKAEIYENSINEKGELGASFNFDTNNQCKLELYSQETGIEAQLIMTYFDMYLAKDDNHATVYATIEDGYLVEVDSKNQAMFEIIMENQIQVTITWLKDNNKYISATTECVNLYSETRTDESSDMIIRTIYTDRYTPVYFSFVPAIKEIVYQPDIINEKGAKNLNVIFNENNTSKIAADNTDDVFFIMENLFLWYNGEGDRYFFIRDTGWGSSAYQTDDSILKVTTTNVSERTESPKYELTIELLTDLQDILIHTIPEYFKYVKVHETEDETHKYVTYEYDRYEPATLTFVPFGQEVPVEYYVENVEIDNDNSTAMFEFSVDYDKFLAEGTVYLDGNELNKDQYTSRQGSTIIELAKDILDTLSVGIHTLGIQVSDGYVEAAFEIAEEEINEVEPSTETIVEELVNTGDYTPYMISLFIISLIGIVYANKKLVVNK
jgi:hypothetical protein